MLTEIELKEYFLQIYACNYAKAKQIMENALINRHDSPPIMARIVTGFITITTLERNYYSMEFANIRKKSIFSRKNSQSESYSDLLGKMRNISIDSSTAENGNNQSRIFKLSKSIICRICEIRSRFVSMYYEIALIGKNNRSSIMNVIDIVRPLKEYLRQIIDNDCSSMDSIMDPMLILMELEIDVLMCLTEALHLIGNLYFLVPISLLHSANEKCQRLIEICSPITSTSSRLFSRQSHSLNLLAWLTELYNISLAKYTLYFHPILMQKMSLIAPNPVLPYDGRALDFVQRINTFVKKASVSSFLLVFDSSKQNHPFLGHGYVFPSGYGECPSGLQSYPVIFSYPTETTISRKTHCSIVMLIGRMNNNSKNQQDIEYLAEPDGGKTFFVSFIDFRVYLIIIFDERREREKLIINFIESLRMDLNGKSVIDQLALINS